LNEKGERTVQLTVPAGPTGLALDEPRNRLYVLSKFDAAISTIDLADDRVISTTNLFDPTPEVIKKGRPHLYNATKSSGLGHLSCATCHVDARMDPLAWDLGDPAGEIKEFNQTCNIGLLQLECKDWHPMKGPMTTQTLIGTVGNRPLHWRGDREDIAAFNGAFESLLGAEAQLSDEDMAEFEAFLATIVHPPNPNRRLDGTLRDAMQLRGRAASPARGFDLFQNAASDRDLLKCVDCHALPQGVSPVVVGGSILASPQQAVISQLENIYEKTGFDVTSRNNNRGFGLTHDGAFDHVANFLTHPVFTLPTDQDRLDLEAFVLSFSTTTHAAVGKQVTLNGNPMMDADSLKLLDDLRREADGLRCGLVALGRRDGAMRGFVYRKGPRDFETDGNPSNIAFADLVASAKPGAELTFTAVPIGAERRIAFDRDEDGVPDLDDAATGRAIGREWFAPPAD
ncbi:MAG TPA: hypothetical protein VNT79_15430, partial [Phycisphaerae bacterium]|nr:hypothetical protein [Phycisphaerae bacterium]